MKVTTRNTNLMTWSKPLPCLVFYRLYQTNFLRGVPLRK